MLSQMLFLHFVVSISLPIFFFAASSSPEQAPYSSFARDAKWAPPVVYADYIVIGGGTSGCALASTLSQGGAKVVLLERGGLPYGNPNITSIGGFPATLADTSPTSASQLFLSTDGVFNHRARVLGGGSAINAGFYTRASSDYVVAAGWNPRTVNESYEWVEKKVVFEPPMLTWQSAVRDGLLEAGVGKYNGFTYEHLMGTKVGGTMFDGNGYRHTAADLLEYADPTQIEVYLRATVHQILFRTVLAGQKPKAYGVYFRDSNGARHMAYLNNGPMNEIILSSGAIGSPQLLMLSGIGPAQQLRAQGIKVIMDQPNVGQGMSDNPMNAAFIPSPRPVELSLIQVVGITHVGSFIEAASGFWELVWAYRNAPEVAKFQNQYNMQTDQLFTIPFNESMQEVMPGPDPYRYANIQAGVVLEKIAGPFSTGHLELQSRDPNDNPRVTFNYFKDPRDLQRCVQGMEIVRQVVESRSLSTFRYPFTTMQTLMNMMLTFPINLRPKHLTSAYSMEQFCVDTVMTIWHYHGGCQVGRVLDENYKVLGVDSLRVIDGSTFYNSPGTNPQATVMMLGRYMGQRILHDRNPH